MERRIFIQSLLISSGTFILNPKNISAAFSGREGVRLSMIYNNISGNDKMKSAWGLAVWIEAGDESILFDTGGDPAILLENLENSGFDASKLSAIVISHNHWDHTGGLSRILKKTENKAKLYVPAKNIRDFRERYPDSDIIGVMEAVEISKDIRTTGQTDISYRNVELGEQSVIIENEGSLFILTGCSHFGIDRIVEKVKELMPGRNIELVAGGFHLIQSSESDIERISERMKTLGVRNIAPSHCTGDKALEIFKKDWGDRYVDFFLGDKITV